MPATSSPTPTSTGPTRLRALTLLAALALLAGACAGADAQGAASEQESAAEVATAEAEPPDREVGDAGGEQEPEPTDHDAAADEAHEPDADGADADDAHDAETGGAADGDAQDADHGDADEDADHGDADHQDADAHGGHHGDAPADAQTVRVAGREFAFDQAELSVEAGRPVAVTYVNTGDLEHDWVLFADDGAQIAHAHAYPGEEATVVFTLEPGTYEVRCTVPGHADAGMTGSVTAE